MTVVNLVLFLVSGDPVFRVSDVSLQPAKASVFKVSSYKILRFLFDLQPEMSF